MRKFEMCRAGLNITAVIAKAQKSHCQVFQSSELQFAGCDISLKHLLNTKFPTVESSQCNSFGNHAGIAVQPLVEFSKCNSIGIKKPEDILAWVSSEKVPEEGRIIAQDLRGNLEAFTLGTNVQGNDILGAIPHNI
jgi:hypothetical protein